MEACIEIPHATEGHLAGVFSAFIAAAARLEDTHRQLHGEVARLRWELEDRNRALASSLAENERMRIVLGQILDALPCGVVVVEMPAEKVVRMNPEARRLLDLRGDELASNGNLPDWIRSAIGAAMHSPEEHGYELELAVEKEGNKRWLAVRSTRMASASPARGESGGLQVISIIRDITGHKNAEQDRESARNFLALAEISTVLAHEIRNPLGSLELLTQCLAGDSRLSEESKQCVAHLQAGVRSLSATVSNVLRFHHPDSVPLRPFELASVVQGSVEFVRPLAKQKNIQLRLRHSLGQVEIAGDPDGLRQVLLNLLCNGLRHTPAKGSITVTSWIEACEGGRRAVIEVADTGDGIRTEDLPRIFDPGFTTTGSSGLGLAVCRRIMEQHRGNMAARSGHRQGATFRLEIPAL